MAAEIPRDPRDPQNPQDPKDPTAHGARVAMLALSRVPGVGAVLGRRILERFGSPAAVAAASAAQLSEIEGISQAGAAAFIRSFDLDAAARELDRALAAGFEVLTLVEHGYPATLAALSDAPLVLHVRGALAGRDAAAVAIVGTRGASKYGREVGRRLAADLAGAGVTVVSGMALGIDTAAHEGALASGGRTLAILGSGLDKVYPPENRSLAERIVQSGAILSEYPLGTNPLARNFPRRNRIISGLSLGVVVVEASARSGAMITARVALDQGREVFAVPGAVGAAGSAGPHGLIKSGAKLVEGVEDILEELPALANRLGLKTPGALDDSQDGETERAEPAFLDVGETARAVLAVIGSEPIHIDEAASAAGLRVAEVSAALVELELAGVVRAVGAMRFVRS